MSGTKSSSSSPKLDPALVDLLVCPVTHGPLRYDAEANCLVSIQAGLAFPIRDGVPVMLEEEATIIEDNSA
jgi:uncharacterized protein YbaR (Trm112 family)